MSGSTFSSSYPSFGSSFSVSVGVRKEKMILRFGKGCKHLQAFGLPSLGKHAIHRDES